MRQTFLLLFACSTVLLSCHSAKTFLRNDQIPPDFGKGNAAISVPLFEHKAVNRSIEKIFEKYYKGPYAIVTGDKPMPAGDKREFRYVFHVYTEFSAGRFTASGREGPSSSYYFGVTDTKTGKDYKMNRFGGYSKLAKHYVQALEIARQRNQ